MTSERSPARLGIGESQVSRCAAVGWIADGLVAEAAVEPMRRIRRGPDPEATLDRLLSILEASPDLVRRSLQEPMVGSALAAIAGSSRALTATLRANPDWLAVDEKPAMALLDDTTPLAGRLRAIRRFVRRRLLWIAVRDLLGLASMPEVGRDLADTADAAAAAALTTADLQTRRSSTLADLPPVPFAVIAMGKWGGRELNYSSDIDVLFVYDPPPGTDPELVRRYATKTATEFMAALGEVTPEGAAFRVDANLRPEGKNGPLARSLDSYAGYYDQWAHTWEYQALIKARPAAGDPHLGQRFTTLISPHIYPETLPPDTIRTIRTMKARIEGERLGPGEDPDFHLKLGRGGMNDVEFIVQLLQMKHGGLQPDLRVPGTIDALEQLANAELLPSAEGEILGDAYRLCAQLRNRLFLQYGRPIDSLPTDQDELSRLAVSMGRLDAPRSAIREDYRRATRRARRVFERRFFDDP